MQIEQVHRLLVNWANHAERFWHPIPGVSGQGCYGSGYNAWGVQTNQKYVSALGTLAVLEKGSSLVDPDWAFERAMSALRYNLDSHLTGKGACTDGTQWGHTWISGLGIERMMHAVYLLEPRFSDQDRAALKRVLTSEADWLLENYQKGAVVGIGANPWDHTGKNQPESNIWNGALLWRAAVMYPDHTHAQDWKERAHTFLINGVSVAEDALDESILEGKSVRERHIGANFFPNYALDHHGYLNVGYMVICLSNAAMLHFDLKKQGLPRPATLDHHQADLWGLVRRLVFQGGRLARIGGDTRVRYAYCQDYLLPALLYAADRFRDAHALELASAQVELIQQEADFNQDGSFYGRRLADLQIDSPYYYTRLESDRACALAQLITWLPQVDTLDLPQQSFEESVAGSWSEEEHGAVFHRSTRRLASFAWRAHGLAQGMCQPPDQPHLPDWEGNLCGKIDFLSHTYSDHPSRLLPRRLVEQRIDLFPGGFVTYGTLIEGAEVEMVEGWRGKEMAGHQVVFAALPDDRSVIGMEYCRVNQARAYLREVQGMHLNLANDLYNQFSREIAREGGFLQLDSPPAQSEYLPTGSRWLNLAGCLGIVGLYGSDEFVISRSFRRRGGVLGSLFVEEIGWPIRPGPFWAEAGELLLDAGWMVLSGVDGSETRSAVAGVHASGCPVDVFSDASGIGLEEIRLVSLRAGDGANYTVLANFGKQKGIIPVQAFDLAGSSYVDLSSQTIYTNKDQVQILPGSALVMRKL